MNELNRLRQFPKIELHRHLEGSLRSETLWEFHCQQKQSMHASLDALQHACTIPEGDAPGFMAFLSRFEGLRFKYGGTEALERIAAEAVEDAASDGVIHLELRFSPVFCARRMKDAIAMVPLVGMPETGYVPDRKSARQHMVAPIAVPPHGTTDTIHEAEVASAAVIRGARTAAKRFGISVSFIVTLARHFGYSTNLPAANLLDRPIGSMLCGLDLAGAETHPDTEFEPMLKAWQAAGRPLTLHAGEDPCGGGPEKIRQSLQLGATRIGHGVRAIEDPELVSLLATRRVPLEMCPTSNMQTHACRSFETHPMKALLEAGVNVTLNTDDPSISRTTLSAEYLHALNDCGLSWSQLRTCALNAARAVFLPSTKRQELVARIEESWK